MIETTEDARSALEAQGLHVSVNNPSSLLIGSSVVAGGDGLQLFKDACAVNRRAGEWVAAFPAEGLLSYEVQGTLPELVALVSAVYNRYRQTGGEFQYVFKGLVQDAERYLIGRSLMRV